MCMPAGKLGQRVQEGLVQIAAALDAQDYNTVSTVQVWFCVSLRLSQHPWHVSCARVLADSCSKLVSTRAIADKPADGVWYQDCISAGTEQPMCLLQTNLTSTDWDECSTWLTVLKRLVRQRMTLP